jgi:hypothetical protein
MVTGFQNLSKQVPKTWLGLGVVFLCSFFFFCLVWISSFQNVIKLKSESKCGHKFFFFFFSEIWQIFFQNKGTFNFWEILHPEKGKKKNN